MKRRRERARIDWEATLWERTTLRLRPRWNRCAAVVAASPRGGPPPANLHDATTSSRRMERGRWSSAGGPCWLLPRRAPRRGVRAVVLRGGDPSVTATVLMYIV